jgi:hypothetical protein
MRSVTTSRKDRKMGNPFPVARVRCCPVLSNFIKYRKNDNLSFDLVIKSPILAIEITELLE